MEKHAARANPEFFPENVEFLGFIGSWGCYVGVVTVQTLFYLIRTKEQDWLEEVAKYSKTIMSRHCVIGIPRHGSKQEAAARLLDVHVRSRVHYECPIAPYRSGLLTSDKLKSIVGAIAEERKHNIRVAEKEQRRREAPIIKMARELGLDPRPTGHNERAWMAGCPQSRNHWIMISPSQNDFGCGYCRRKGGPAELEAFAKHVKARAPGLRSAR